MPWQPSFPCVRHYADGRQALVFSPEELATLEPGHADTPAGPFPEPPAPGWDVADVADVPEDPSSRSHEARRRYVAGQSQRTIARDLGVSRRTVQGWLKEEDDGRDC